MLNVSIEPARAQLIVERQKNRKLPLPLPSTNPVI